MAECTFYVYCIGTACGDCREDFLFDGPLNESQAQRLVEGHDRDWYAVSYIVYEPNDVPGEFSRHPADRDEFFRKAQALCLSPFFNTCHGSDSERELQAWYDQFAGAPPTDKVQPFWWETPAGGSRVNARAAWAATVAIAKGA